MFVSFLLLFKYLKMVSTDIDRSSECPFWDRANLSKKQFFNIKTWIGNCVVNVLFVAHQPGSSFNKWFTKNVTHKLKTVCLTRMSNHNWFLFVCQLAMDLRLVFDQMVVFDQLRPQYVANWLLKLFMLTFANNMWLSNWTCIRCHIWIWKYVIDFWFVICYDHHFRIKHLIQYHNVSRDRIWFNVAWCENSKLLLQIETKIWAIGQGNMKLVIVIWNVLSVLFCCELKKK